MKPKIIVSVTNDITHDHRVYRACSCFEKNGYDVLWIGIKRKNSLAISFPNIRTHRFRLLFSKNFLFYAEVQFRLFFFLLFKKYDILYANDLDTLPANFLLHKLKRIPLIYDSHEYFTEVPDLKPNSFQKKCWERIEAFIFPQLKNVITVCDSIALIYKKKHGVDLSVIRNLPTKKGKPSPIDRVKLGIAKDKKIIIYQGSFNIDRGLEELIEAMQFLDEEILLIMGGGDVESSVKERTKELGLENKIIFTGKIAPEILFEYTCLGDVGVSMEKGSNLNYLYCLPNKLFNYIQAEVPVLVSNLPEMKKIIDEYQVGEYISSHDPKILAKSLHGFLQNTEQLRIYRENEKRAKTDLCWEKEEKKLMQLLKNIKA